MRSARNDISTICRGLIERKPLPGNVLSAQGWSSPAARIIPTLLYACNPEERDQYRIHHEENDARQVRSHADLRNLQRTLGQHTRNGCSLLADSLNSGTGRS